MYSSVITITTYWDEISTLYLFPFLELIDKVVSELNLQLSYDLSRCWPVWILTTLNFISSNIHTCLTLWCMVWSDNHQWTWTWTDYNIILHSLVLFIQSLYSPLLSSLVECVDVCLLCSELDTLYIAGGPGLGRGEGWLCLSGRN